MFQALHFHLLVHITTSILRAWMVFSLYISSVLHIRMKESLRWTLTNWSPCLPSPDYTELLQGRNCPTQLLIHPVCAALSLVHRYLPKREACIQVIKERGHIIGRETSSLSCNVPDVPDVNRPGKRGSSAACGLSGIQFLWSHCSITGHCCPHS